ncbi:hypothetical protein BGZ98_001753 [Dissophora globulifera]|nr:hypothetical protein BGZ98_001753 [Dissophora globulifera]
MVFGGEYVCMQLEMEPILIGGGGGSSQAAGSGDVRNNARNNTRRESVNTTNSNSNINNNNNNEAGGSGSNNDSLSMQGAALSGTHYDEPYLGYGDESAGLLMDTLDSSKINADTSSAERGIPQKSRPNGDANVVRGGFAPGIRSSVLGDLTRGRQRTSDGYNKVSATDADNR